jgi:hypothetical protein
MQKYQNGLIDLAKRGFIEGLKIFLLIYMLRIKREGGQDILERAIEDLAVRKLPSCLFGGLR